MTDRIKTKTDIEQRDIYKVWKALWELAQSCTHWGKSDVDKEKFIKDGQQLFDVRTKE